jgi:hypothetical protein
VNLEQFATQYNVKTKRDDCGDTIVPGKVGDIFYGYDNGKLGVCIMLDTRKRWNRVRRLFEEAGMVIKQDADTEGVATFDPTDRKQARLALQLARVKTRRNVSAPSPAQLAARQAFADRNKKALQVA